MAMRALFAATLAASAFGAAGCSPFGAGSFACTDNTQCSGGGQCEAGFCAFTDSSCASGLRYGGLSGPMSNTCYAGDLTDGGAGDAPPIDAMPGSDAALDAGATGSDAGGQTCYVLAMGQVCFAQPLTTAATLSGPIDTGGAMCATVTGDGAGLGCVIGGSSVSVADVTVTGTKPLVLISASTLDVTGTLGIASHDTGATTTHGAGADGNTCTAASAANAGGGAGGSFGSKGGNGGGGGGNAGDTTPPATLRGGCPGETGGGGMPGAGGPGGGAVYLFATTSISITGAVDASGAGGRGGTSGGASGGGGGAGGMVVLDSPLVTVAGSIFANGGGGGEGAGTTNAGGTGGDPAAAGTAAPGGSGKSNRGGDGGAGAIGDGTAATAAVNGNGPTMAGGGAGGGGGGVGAVKLYQATTIGGGGMVSPPAS